MTGSAVSGAMSPSPRSIRGHGLPGAERTPKRVRGLAAQGATLPGMTLEASLIPLEGRARVRGVCAVSRQGRAGRGGVGVIIGDASRRRTARLTPRQVLPDVPRLAVMV